VSHGRREKPHPRHLDIAGISGPFRDHLVDSITRLVDGIPYTTRTFRRPLTPSDLLKGLFTEKQVDVAARFAKPMACVTGTCARHPPCNAHVRGLGKGLPLADFFGWEIRCWFYGRCRRRPPKASAPTPSA
jgi:hypothetical protein